MDGAAARSRWVKEAAVAAGFDLCGVARAAALPPEPLDRWLAAGMHADMAWMAERRDERLDPARIVRDARSVVSLAVNYFSPDPEAPSPAEGPFGRVARYARNRDYHNVLAGRARKLRKRCEKELGGRWYGATDTGPVMEKAWAERAGLGWIGKNGCLITERFGSWVLLATLITDVVLEADAPHEERCGACEACLPACPTGALVSPGVVDARRCISYETIERRAPGGGAGERATPPGAGGDGRAADVPVPLHGWIFGCDACQDVCPWNRRAEPTRHAAFTPRAEQTWLPLAETARIDDAEFHARFTGTPIARARPEGLRRNARALLSLPVVAA